MTLISLVIPTRDRPGPLVACLRAIAADFPSDAETLVVSDGGREDLTSVVAPFVEPLALRLLPIEHCGPAAARNRGLAAARGRIVAFTDDDCRARPGWLSALAAEVATAPPRAVGGSTVNGLPGNPYADAAQLVLRLLARHDRASTGRERFLPSNNFAFPAEPLRRIGGFDERFRTAEDRELCRRWADHGYELHHVSGAVVEHDQRLDFRRFVSKFFSYGRGAARFHASGGNVGLRESARFHFCLPSLLLPELRRRGWRRGAAVASLLILWEVANLVGFVAEGRRASRLELGADLSGDGR